MFLTLNLISLYIVTTKSPILMSILILALMILINLNLTLISTWASYILFLVFLGGIMIIFVYVISLTKNETLNIKAAFACVLIISFENLMTIKMIFSVEKIFLPNFSAMTSISILYLLMALLVVIRMIFTSKIPMRASK